MKLSQQQDWDKNNTWISSVDMEEIISSTVLVYEVSPAASSAISLSWNIASLRRKPWFGMTIRCFKIDLRALAADIL